ncbi:MAG: hypothetical protein BWX77_00155 [Bacteroidetes bacterium ADurb.Bin090]|nr:MAG: hypothetical protein BWX77_00155 [Bacteroidetes bacterium ADurb.Bin090]
MMAEIDDFLLYAFHLVAQHQRILLSAIEPEVLQRNTACGLFGGIKDVTLFAQGFKRLQAIFLVSPVYGEFSPQGRFVNLGLRRAGTDAAQYDFLDQKGIGSTKHRTYVVQAAHIIQNQD